MTGHIVFEKNQASGNGLMLERGDLKSGIYFYELISEGSILNGKIVITD
jgi:hypothetical protein